MEENKEGSINYFYIDNEDRDLKRKVRTLSNIVAFLAGSFIGLTYYVAKNLNKDTSKEDTTKGE